MADETPQQKFESLQKRKAEGKLGIQEYAQELMKLGGDSPNILQAVMGAIGSDPETAKYVLKMQQQTEAGKLSGKIATGVDALVKAGLTASSLKQIANSNRLAGQIATPQLPPNPTRDPRLEDALNRARGGTIDVNQVLAPAKQGIQDAAAAGMATAQSASRGQAGAYGSMANQINQQRMRAALGLAPIAQQVKSENAQIENQLLGQRAYETQNLLNTQTANAGLAFDQYNRDRAIVGGLGQAGRTNLAEVATSLPDTFRNVADYMVPKLFQDNKTSNTDALVSQSMQEFMNGAYSENSMWQGGMNWKDIYNSNVAPKGQMDTTGLPGQDKYKWNGY
jgi:hypothetical protein